jgi:hypothetical protein
MKRPLLSHEVAWLARLLVYISSSLNNYYNLPQDKSTISLSWMEVDFEPTPPLPPPSLTTSQVLSRSSIGLKSYLIAIRASFRINLRLLASTSTLCLVSWLVVFGIYQIANLSEIWLAFFTGFLSLLLLLASVQDTLEVGPLDDIQTAQLDANRDRYHHGALTNVSPTCLACFGPLILFSGRS